MRFSQCLKENEYDRVVEIYENKLESFSKTGKEKRQGTKCWEESLRKLKIKEKLKYKTNWREMEIWEKYNTKIKIIILIGLFAIALFYYRNATFTTVGDDEVYRTSIET